MADRKRWEYRLDNFGRALRLLRDGVETLEARALSQLEKEGLVQRFEYSWELAWKTLSDYVQDQGLVLPAVTPRAVVRAAFEAGVIADGADWMAALDARNRMSHSYSEKAFEAVIAEVRAVYLDLFAALHDRLAAEGAG